ncbi:MAG: DUF1674 domain-containing protein [Alphaproteobacteria bacterium]|jgi:hypothetical protein|nr:DUF1674 domain-containing protein [Alphaproteobacteria bacterium]
MSQPHRDDAAPRTERRPGDDAATTDTARDHDTPQTDQASGEDGSATQPPGEKGGPKGPEPTRFGDWEKNGRCFDF